MENAQGYLILSFFSLLLLMHIPDVGVQSSGICIYIMTRYSYTGYVLPCKCGGWKSVSFLNFVR